MMIVAKCCFRNMRNTALGASAQYARKMEGQKKSTMDTTREMKMTTLFAQSS